MAANKQKEAARANFEVRGVGVRWGGAANKQKEAARASFEVAQVNSGLSQWPWVFEGF